MDKLGKQLTYEAAAAEQRPDRGGGEDVKAEEAVADDRAEPGFREPRRRRRTRDALRTTEPIRRRRRGKNDPKRNNRRRQQIRVEATKIECTIILFIVLVHPLCVVYIITCTSGYTCSVTAAKA